MNKKAIISGIAGQDAAFMSQLLLSKGYSVIGFGRSLSEEKLWRLRELKIQNSIELLSGDITDTCFVFDLFRKYQPDEFYNFAAISFVGQSWILPSTTMGINYGGVINILEAIKQFSPTTKFYQPGSSEMFGRPIIDLQTEETNFLPCNPYGVSKVAAFQMAKIYREAYRVFVCNAICFNHESELRGIEYVTRKITDGVARIKLGLASELRLGNIKVSKDWGNALDFVEAMWLMLQQEKPNDYIISSGELHSIEEFLDNAFFEVDIKEWRQYVVEDPKFFRPIEPYTLCGDHSKITKLLGWSPKIGFKETIHNMLRADLDRLSKNLQHESK